MDEREALAFAATAVAFATEHGADAAEATVAVSRRFHVEAREKTLSKLEHSTGRSLSVRLFSQRRKVALVTSDFSQSGLEDSIVRAVEQARFVAPDEHSGLPESCGRFEGDLALYDAAVAERDDASKVDDALEMERLIREADPRIVKSGGSHYADTHSVIAIVNSTGFAQAYTGTYASRSTSPVAEEGDIKRTAHYGTAARHAKDLDSNAIVASRAAQRTVEMFGAKKPPTERLPVIFERDIAAALLADVFAAINAGNVAVGNSWLAERVGERVGSDLVTMIDDGTMLGHLGSAPFDGEGVPTRRTVVFERGVLKTLLFDAYYARKLGAKTTGNSTGGGVGPNNFYFQPGTQTLEALIAATPRGILVLDTIGFATEHATGTYSRGARGFMIENGELSYPIDEFTVAGSFPEMLAGIDAVANDLRFDGSIVAPSLRISEMTVSGTQSES